MLVLVQVVEESMIRAVFSKVDADGSGALDEFEVRRMGELVGIMLTDGELDTAMLEMDEDNSGPCQHPHPHRHRHRHRHQHQH